MSKRQTNGGGRKAEGLGKRRHDVAFGLSFSLDLQTSSHTVTTTVTSTALPYFYTITSLLYNNLDVYISLIASICSVFEATASLVAVVSGLLVWGRPTTIG